MINIGGDSTVNLVHTYFQQPVLYFYSFENRAVAKFSTEGEQACSPKKQWTLSEIVIINGEEISNLVGQERTY